MRKIPEHVKEFITRVPVVYVATADRRGRPHMATVQGLTVVDAERISFTSWFCPKTVQNVAESAQVAVAVWDPAQNRGYQLLGSIEKVEDLAVLDGYVPSVEKAGTTPQVQRRLLMRIDSILDFHCSPHSDSPIHVHEGH